MTEQILLLPILIPIIASLVTLCLTKKNTILNEVVAGLATLATLVVTIALWGGELAFTAPWGGFGIEFSLRLYQFSSFIILAASAFAVLIVLYSFAFMKGKAYVNLFYTYLLITLGFTNGAVLSNNLVVMLFFWEGLLLALLGFIAIGGKASYKTAIKAFIIVGVTDLCMMLGIALVYHISGTLEISSIKLGLDPWGATAFTLLMIGAISKAGSMPFHSWIPDAALDAPLPFMAFVPAALEKLLGIYFLVRISLDMFALEHGHWVSVMMMTIGSLTILFAVMMALIQKDYKKLLSFHAISQVGYMILGIGTALPVGIIGGIFHMINHAMYKSCLFLTAGSVEHQTGTTDLRKLGGIGRKMPITFTCFIVAAASISGVPPFNGFFSKELVYDGALESGVIFYVAAILGSVLTAASFLKLGHSAFLGKENENSSKAKEAPAVMLVPMIVIAFLCVLFGVYNALPLRALIQPVLGTERLAGHDFAGFPASAMLILMTVAALAVALLNHLYGVKRTGSGLKAADHIHHAPVLGTIYDKAENRLLDPYEHGLKLVNLISRVAWAIDRGIDFVYDKVIVFVSQSITRIFQACHTGVYSTYLIWSLVGVVVMLAYVLV